MIQGNAKNETRPWQTDVVLRDIEFGDLPEVVDVHLDSFPQSALSRLGPSIVDRYYRWQLEGPHKKVRAVGAFRDDKCVGFSFSGEFNGSTSGFLKRNRGYLAGMVMLKPWLLLNPLFFDRFRSGVKLVVFKRKKKEKVAAAVTDQIPKQRSYGILSIAVALKYQQYGIGKILMADAEREAVECEYPQMHLTVSPDNSKAVRFYERLGWIKREENGEWRGFMVKPLIKKSSSANAGISAQ